MNVKELGDELIAKIKSYVARQTEPLEERVASLEARIAMLDGSEQTLGLHRLEDRDLGWGRSESFVAKASGPPYRANDVETSRDGRIWAARCDTETEPGTSEHWMELPR